MLKSPRRYISLSFRFILKNVSTIKSMNTAWFGGLQKTPVVIGFDLGKRMSKQDFQFLCNAEFLC